MERYGSSKIANIFFAEKLHQKFSEEQDPVHPIISVALHPGAIAETNLARYLGVGGLVRMLYQMWLDGTLGEVFHSKFKTIPQGAATQLFLAVGPAPEEVVSGEYYSNCSIEKVKRHPKIADQHYIDELWRVSLELNKMNE